MWVQSIFVSMYNNFCYEADKSFSCEFSADKSFSCEFSADKSSSCEFSSSAVATDSSGSGSKASGDSEDSELDEEGDEVDEFCWVSTISSRIASGGLVSSWLIISSDTCNFIR